MYGTGSSRILSSGLYGLQDDILLIQQSVNGDRLISRGKTGTCKDLRSSLNCAHPICIKISSQSVKFSHFSSAIYRGNIFSYQHPIISKKVSHPLIIRVYM